MQNTLTNCQGGRKHCVSTNESLELLEETVKTATLMEEDIGTDCKKVIIANESCIRSKESCDTRGQADINIGAISEGKAK